MLTILGGGGWLPAHGRHTACALLRRGAVAIMIDAGTGVARGVERPELFADLEHLDLVLTHFHLDHLVGLAYLPALGMSDRVTIWGPGRLLYGTPTSELLGQVSREPFHPLPLEKQQIEVRDLDGDEVELAGMGVRMRRQDRHSSPTLGLRFDDALAWITDTALDPDTAGFVRGCGLLAHEAWCTTSAPKNEDIHTSAAHAARVALDAEIERLLLIHLPPFERSVDGLVNEAQASVPGSLPALDGTELPLSGD